MNDIIKIFVYGTLMKGMCNYNRYLYPLEPAGTGIIRGFCLFDLGYYPGIVNGDSTVRGEVYEIDDTRLSDIDRLEGNGSLYTRTIENVELDSGESVEAWVYVYNHSVDGCEKISPCNQPYKSGNDLVWYVSYGSNLLEERFKCYVQGGLCSYNGRNYNPCSDISLPVKSIPVEIPFNMYFSNESGSWGGKAVSFIDLSKPGYAYGRAYLIRKSQLEEIHEKEGTGDNWYPDCVRLEDIDGIPAYTYANENKAADFQPLENVSDKYLTVLFRGIKETYPEKTEGDIISYLNSCCKKFK